MPLWRFRKKKAGGTPAIGAGLLSPKYLRSLKKEMRKNWKNGPYSAFF
jgi:hypothetical protein